MMKKIFDTLLIHRILSTFIFIPVLLIALTSRCSGQDEGVSLHGDLYSLVFAQNFEKNFYHPGNFLLGAQYNLPASNLVEFNGGFDFLWVEPYGIISNSFVEAQVFIPFIFAGIALNIDEWRIFGEVGYSLSNSVNILGSNKGWVSSILDFNMESFQFGLKIPIYEAISLSTSARFYAGDKIMIGKTPISFSSINFGLSYNLFGGGASNREVSTGADAFKEKYYTSQAENRILYQQIVDLHDSIKSLNLKVVRIDTLSKQPVFRSIPIETLSVDSLNKVYNLHIGEPLDIKDFVNKTGLKEEGKLILGEYNRIASLFTKLPYGIYFLCDVPELRAFTKNESEFPRINFRSETSNKNTLVINIDIVTTESRNKIKLDIK
jgi:hypothetical protein